MKNRQLVNGTTISALGMGCSSYWSNPSFSADLAVDLVQQAIEGGLNSFDTGPSYGAGVAETRLGKAIKNAQRSQLVVSTKGGTFVDSKGKLLRTFDPHVLRDQLLRSLDRLRTEYIDIYYLHGPAIRDISDATLDFLAGIKQEGLVKLVGINSFDRQVLQFAEKLPVDVIMAQFNISDTRCVHEIEALQKSGKTVIGATALGQLRFVPTSFLPTSKKSLWYLLRALKNDPGFLFRGAQIRRDIAASGLSPVEAALNFVLNTPALTSSFFGTTSAAHLAHNLAWLRARNEAVGAEQAVQTRSEAHENPRI